LHEGRYTRWRFAYIKLRDLWIRCVYEWIFLFLSRCFLCCLLFAGHRSSILYYRLSIVFTLCRYNSWLCARICFKPLTEVSDSIHISDVPVDDTIDNGCDKEGRINFLHKLCVSSFSVVGAVLVVWNWLEQQE
jgi:hypothetical protein